jgi:putative transposase
MSQAFGHRRSIRLPTYDYTQSGAYFITICTQNRQRFFGDVKNGVMCLSDCGRTVDQTWRDLPSRFPWIITDTFQIMPDHIHAIIWIHHPVDGKGPTRAIRRGESHSPLLETHSSLGVNTYHESSSSSENTGHNTDAMASAKNDGHDEGSTVDECDVKIGARDLTRDTWNPTTGERGSRNPRTDKRDIQKGEWDLKKKKGEWDSPLQCGTSKTVGSIVRGLKIPVTQWARQSMGIQNVWQRNYFERIIRSQQDLESIRQYIINNPADWRAD